MTPYLGFRTLLTPALPLAPALPLPLTLLKVTPYLGFRTLLKGTRASGTTFEAQPFMPAS